MLHFDKHEFLKALSAALPNVKDNTKKPAQRAELIEAMNSQPQRKHIVPLGSGALNNQPRKL